MRLVSFVAGGTERWGFVVDDPTTGAPWVVEPGPATLVEFLALAGPDDLTRTISAMIRDEYEAGEVIRGGIAGLGEVSVTIQGAR